VGVREGGREGGDRGAGSSAWRADTRGSSCKETVALATAGIVASSNLMAV
jgi:hypothetical protein